MTENKIATLILDACFKIHRKLGPGLFESVYEEILAYEFEQMELSFQRQVPIPVIWDDVKLDQGYRADLIIEEKVIIEVKSIETIAPVHHKQILTYLKLTDLRLGLLINFNTVLLKDGIQRIANNL